MIHPQSNCKKEITIADAENTVAQLRLVSVQNSPYLIFREAELLPDSFDIYGVYVSSTQD